jgi:hypothetical protein
MKSLAVAIALIAATTVTASATYRLSPNMEPDQIEQYEFFHTQLNQFHAAEPRGAKASRQSHSHTSQTKAQQRRTAWPDRR